MIKIFMNIKAMKMRTIKMMILIEKTLLRKVKIASLAELLFSGKKMRL